MRSPLSPQLQSSPPTPFTAPRETPQAAIKAQGSQKKKKKKKKKKRKHIKKKKNPHPYGCLFDKTQHAFQKKTLESCINSR